MELKLAVSTFFKASMEASHFCYKSWFG